VRPFPLKASRRGEGNFFGVGFLERPGPSWGFVSAVGR